MEKTTLPITKLSQLEILPLFAAYLRDNCLAEYVQEQLKIAAPLQIPLLQVFAHVPEETRNAVYLQSSYEYLDYLAKGQAEQYVVESARRWKENQLPQIDKDAISVSDITLIAYVRKQAMLQFAPEWCASTEKLLRLIGELDFFMMNMEDSSFKTYLNLLQQKLDEQAYLTNKITNTSPGIIYLFSMQPYSVLFANQTAQSFFGFTNEEFVEMGTGVFERLIHPEDLPATFQFLRDISHARDTEVRTIEFRMRPKTGGYVWMRNYISVFRRDAGGMPSEIIGNILNIQAEKEATEKLLESERRYRQAEALTHIGHYEWDLKTDLVLWSEELSRIYGMDANQPPLTAAEIFSFTHPEDLSKIHEQMQAALTTGSPYSFYFRILVPATGELKILHSQGDVMLDPDGQPHKVVGTLQDVTERQLLVEQLRESQKLYQQAQVLAKLGNWSLDLKTKKVTWSDEMFHIYEMPQGSVPTYEEWQQRIHPADRTEFQAVMEGSVAQKQPIDKLVRIVLPSGKIKTLHRRAEIILDNNGEPVKIIGTTQDVTEQNRVQQELKENQAFLRKITDAAPSIIASYNADSGQYVFVSEGLRTLLGYDPNQLAQGGHRFFQSIIHPDDLEAVLAKKNDIRSEQFLGNDGAESILEFTYRLRHANGTYRWFHTYATVFDRNASGKAEHILNISLDITDQKEASKKLMEQEQFIQNIADASPTILYVFDVTEANFAYVNREIYFVLGFTPEDIAEMGADVTQELYHPEDYHLLPERRQSQRRINQTDVMIQYECRLRHKSGEWLWFLVREVVFRTDDQDRPLQIVGAALDISKRKEMEKTLLQNSFMLEQSNASLEEFAYVASHDLKEPLRKISTFGDRLAATQAEKLSPEGKLFLSKIIDASQRMQTMISDLLSISMISGNKSYESYSLQKVLDETLQTLEFKIEQKNAVVESDGLPVAWIVVSQFRQLFQNLISNSLKFVSEDVQPRITIRHSYLEPTQVLNFQLNPAHSYLKIEFKDNGIGFENENAGKIFLVFQRLHGRSEYEGSGIGLAICKKIVEHHGGVIYAAGEPGAGATFTIILPAGSPAADV